MTKSNSIARESPKRRRILDVAGKMFMAQGFTAISMDAIAEAAPVSKPTLYHHFKDKKALFAAVTDELCGGLYAAFEKNIKERQQDVESSLKRLAAQYLKLVLSPDALQMYRLVMGESQQFPTLSKAFYEHGPSQTCTLLAEYLSQLDKEHLLKVPDPDMSANLFLSMLKGYPHMQCVLGLKKGLSAKEQQYIIHSVVHLFLVGHGYGFIV